MQAERNIVKSEESLRFKNCLYRRHGLDYFLQRLIAHHILPKVSLNRLLYASSMHQVSDAKTFALLLQSSSLK